MNIFCLVIVLITSSLSRHYLIEIGSNIETGGTEENGSGNDIPGEHDILEEGTASGNDYRILYGTKLCEPGKPCPLYCKDADGNYVMTGQRYHDGCNTCVCTERGFGACTRKGCRKDRNPRQRGVQGLEKLAQSAKIVEENSGNDYEIWTGNESGSAECETGKPCPHCKTADGNYVMPGQSYSDGCNTCLCTEAGHGGCT